MIDSADWTGLPSEIRRVPAMYGGTWSEADDAAMLREYRREDRRDRLSAIATLIGLKGQRGEEWTLRRAVLCIIAIALGRRHNEDRHGRAGDIFDMGHFDYEQLYAGWEATIVQAAPRIRYRIDHDGDWDL